MYKKAKSLADEITRLRRDIHRHPELGFREFRTAALVADTLEEIKRVAMRKPSGKKATSILRAA